MSVPLSAAPSLDAVRFLKAIADETRLAILGLLALTAGLAMLNVHRTWTSDWRVMITVLGWLFVVTGVIRIVLPRVTASVATTITSSRSPWASSSVSCRRPRR